MVLSSFSNNCFGVLFSFPKYSLSVCCYIQNMEYKKKEKKSQFTQYTKLILFPG